MDNVKQASVAGTFYPKDADELLNFIENCADGNKHFSRAIIVPHAGYAYSGKLAGECFGYLERKIKNVFIFAPAHYERIFGCAVCDHDAWQTPLGNISVNKELSKQVADFCDCHVNNFAFKNEHSIEVQLPFIQKNLPKAKIIPVLYGCENFKNLTETIKHFWGNEENGFVISSDLSHFYPEKETNKIDNYTAKMIENNEVQNFEAELACGAVGICGLVNFAKENDFTLIRVGLTNSAAATGDSSRVVGYGGWVLYEGEKNEYIKKYYSDLVVKICKESIQTGLNVGSYGQKEYPCVLEELGACFVTLELNGNLRGCVGSVIAHQPLIKDLVKNAHSAAFSDNRFKPLMIEEFEKLQITISLLSKQTRINLKSEKELLDKLVPNKDGLIIRDGNHQAVFLPVVWEQLPNKKDFLQELKRKAGMSEDYFSETFEAFTFTTTKIS